MSPLSQVDFPLICLFAATGLCPVFGFNIDVSNPVVLIQSADSVPRRDRRPGYFGFSLAFIRSNATAESDIWLLAGTPRGNVANNPGSIPPGLVHRCTIKDGIPLTETCKPFITKIPIDVTQVPGNPAESSVVFDNDNWLGVAVDARHSEGRTDILACSHRFRMNYTQIDNIYPLTGLCLHLNRTDVTSDDLSNFKILSPMVGKMTYARRGTAQTGMSAHVAEMGRLIISLPGYRNTNTTGSVGGLLINDLDYEYAEPLDSLSAELYSGYSVTAFYMNVSLRDDLFVASGIPKYNWTGQVVVLQAKCFTGRSECVRVVEPSAYQRIHGDKFGSYFGASLCAIDLNNDGHDDLLVGAPTYNQSRGDEGAVYVFMNRKNGYLSNQSALLLTGSGQRDARFGTAMTSLGDINLDGYNDFVVGAPFEDDGRGAIYIYHGSERLIKRKYVQRLTPSLIGRPNLRTFGHSFAGGMDLDNNKYMDLAVSAIVSDNIILLRTRPVHIVSANFRFSKPFIEWHIPGSCSSMLSSSDQHSPCYPRDVDAFCVLVTLVFNYSTQRGDPTKPESSSSTTATHLKGLAYDLNMDHSLGTVRRGYLMERSSARCHLNGTARTSVNFSSNIIHRAATVEWIAVFPKIPKDIQTPVRFRLNFSAMDPGDKLPDGLDRIKFNVLSPVLDIGAPSAFSGQISFYKECGDDDTCQPELKLLWHNTSHVTVGVASQSMSKVVVPVTVRNDGETAYSAWVRVRLPSTLHYSSILSGASVVTCTVIQGQSTSDENVTTTPVVPQPPPSDVVCDVTNPIGNSSSITFSLVLDAGDVGVEKALDVEDGGLRLDGSVGTFAAGDNDTRGPFKTVIPVFYDSRLSAYGSKDKDVRYILTGSNNVEIILEGRSSPKSADNMLEIAHTLIVGNDGPGLMPRTVVDIRLPVWNDTRRLIADYSVAMTHKSRRDDVIGIYNVSRMWIDDVTSESVDESAVRAVPADQLIRRLHMACNSSMTRRCQNYRFVVDWLKVGEKLEVRVGFLINTAVLLSMPTVIEAKHTIDMAVTPAQLTQRIPGNLDIEALLRQHQIVVKTNTRLIRTTPPSTLPIWVIPVSIVAAMILLTVLVILLKMCGFFKRDQRDQLIKKKRESAPLMGAGPGNGDVDEIEGFDDGREKPPLDAESDRAAGEATPADHQSEYDNDDMSRLNAAAAYLETFGSAEGEDE